MHSIAKELMEKLEGSVAADLLSDFGKRVYFPKGIVAQAAEAKKKAKRLSATVGMATQDGVPLYLKSIYSDFTGNQPGEIFPYAPTPGDLNLRKRWKKEMNRKNPDLEGKSTSVPLVTSGLTHGIFIAADLFLDKGDTIIMPDMFWGNYRLIFEERREANMVEFPFFDERDGINLDALEQAIEAVPGEKAALILNFPNNPTGYSPTNEEADAIVKLLKTSAEKGKKLLVITDDAYFGLFYEKGTCTQSLFAQLADAHENILAVKVDGATKEELVWGFRVGFITYAAKGLTETHYEALTQKTMGAIRSSVSNCSRPAQTLLLKALDSGTYQEEKKAASEILQKRYEKVKEVLAKYSDNKNLVPLPFNSGYFMTFTCRGSAEDLRLYLLNTYEIGTISIKGEYLRIAFSSVNIEQLEELYEVLYKAAGELWD
ncbi:MAG: aminotransferase class I/II-fold pyridoxal phosphate-dependent enzyme [Spirochaetales bacterium]|nr:aminotransferase class I/II-fold pyridoxal phosphate-dependent enzyme [Spirochaetales bacterium]